MNVETAKRLPMQLPMRPHDAAEAARELVEFCSGRTRADLRTDRTLQLVVQKLIEIVGEGLRHAEILDPSLVRTIPDLREIVDTRNRIIHGYESVDYSLLWDIVQDDIPPLRTRLARLLQNAPDLG